MTTTAPDTETHLPHHHVSGTARAALSYRNFRILFVGTALSSIGTWMQNFTLPAYVDSRTGSATLVGLLVFVQLGPLLLLSIPAGMLADRLNRTRLVISMQSVMMVMSIVLAVLVWRDAPASPTPSTPRRSVPASRCWSTAATCPVRSASTRR
jgi:MFS family permease